jgi:catechol 2,3-dioxygenase-like lactoylglutathione lyase family enzyme
MSGKFANSLSMLVVLYAAIWFHGGAFAQPSAVNVEDPYTGGYVRRPTLVVSNMDEALALYRDILGFRLGSLKQDPPDSYVYPAFNIPAGADVMHATLDSDNEVRTLSLVEYKDLMPVDARSDVRRAAVLINANGRFGDIKTKLEEGGFHLLPEHPLGETGVEMGFLDRDGHLIVIYEFPKQ